VGARPGRVDITLDDTTLDAAAATSLGLAPGRHVRLRVQDNGSGMSNETLERIFEPFFTTREVGQGTGLGLAVVHGIMQTHQGGIAVQSRPGLGSTFTLYFPVCDAPPPAASAELAPGEQVQGAGRHVIYVDDDPALVFMVERVLTRRGFRVTTFTDPRAALAALQDGTLNFDLLVTDYNMPGFSGLDLLEASKALRPDMPVALASGYVTAEIEQRALQAGASALVYKPNDVNELCATVQRLVNGAAG